jgi:hypothetical protein
MKALKDAYPKAGDIKDDKVDAVKDLKDAGKDVKGLSLSTTTLDGETAYRIEEQMWILDHWMKDISIFSVKDGKLYQISSLIRPEEMDKYSEAIENMFKSVKFH